MVRYRLTILTVAGLALLTAGCASQYPAPAPTPSEPPAEDASTPAPGAEAEAPPPPAPRARSDTEAPTVALLRQSSRAADSGDLAGAIAYVERAIRLNSRDAALWLELASLQLRAGRPATAEQLAHKAIALAGSRDDQERQGWLLVADAKEAQGEQEEAARIRTRWRTYRG